MKYHWGEWSLDREAGLLTHRGQPVDVSRKVLDCISHLIEHRDRVIGYDELIRIVWGHSDITNHQLSQIVMSTRRLLGDNGHAQRLIRTAAGLGYQWVAVLHLEPPAHAEGNTSAGTHAKPRDPAATTDAHSAIHSAMTDSADTATELDLPIEPRHSDTSRPGADGPMRAEAPPAVLPPRTRGRWAPALAAMLISLICIAAYTWLNEGRLSIAALERGPSRPAAPALELLEESMRKGDFDSVREGLAALPSSRAESPDTMLLTMRLAMYRGRFEHAKELLERQMSLARAAEDPIWQAKLHVFEATLKSRLDSSASEQLSSVQAALDLLAPLEEDAAPDVLADALERHAAVQLLLGRHDEALLDLARSGALYEQLGDARSAIAVRNHRARIWMRTGRLEDALRAMRGVAGDYQRLSDKIGTLAAYNTMSRIQMELLRWDEALATSDLAMGLLREIPEIERRKRVLELRAQILTRMGRLREARALLQESETLTGDQANSMIAILYLLESGQNAAAMTASARAFSGSARDDFDDVLLDTREGALLTWFIAAQRIAQNGSATPSPSPAQIDALRNAQSITGTIAEGRWLMTLDDTRRAESVLREALGEARRKGMRYHMLAALEPLFDLLIAQGRTMEANLLLVDVRAFDRERFDRDFQFTTLRWRLAKATGNSKNAIAEHRKLRLLAGERLNPDWNSRGRK